MKSNITFYLGVSLVVLLLGAISNVTGAMACAAVLNVVWSIWVIIAHVERSPKSKLTSKPRKAYYGRALS